MPGNNRHTLTRADRIFLGDANIPGHEGGLAGLAFSHPYLQEFGAVATADGECIIKDATSTELPNTETVTYLASQTGSPLDAAGLLATTTIQYQGVDKTVWVVPTPRNFVAVATHGSAVVAMTIVITGYDDLMRPVTESLSITAGTTSKTATGKKAFKYIYSVAITAAGDAEANTLDLGSGVLLGLKYALSSAEKAFFNMDGAAQTTVTVAVADTTDPATATTGDSRGTISFNSAPNATRKYSALTFVDHTTANLGFGITPA